MISKYKRATIDFKALEMADGTHVYRSQLAGSFGQGTGKELLMCVDMFTKRVWFEIEGKIKGVAQKATTSAIREAIMHYNEMD